MLVWIDILKDMLLLCFSLDATISFSVSSFSLCRWMPHAIHHTVNSLKNSSPLPASINKHFANRCDSNLNVMATAGNSRRQCLPTYKHRFCSPWQQCIMTSVVERSMKFVWKKILEYRSTVAIFWSECLRGNFLSLVYRPVEGNFWTKVVVRNHLISRLIRRVFPPLKMSPKITLCEDRRRIVNCIGY